MCVCVCVCVCVDVCVCVCVCVCAANGLSYFFFFSSPEPVYDMPLGARSPMMGESADDDTEPLYEDVRIYGKCGWCLLDFFF